MNRKDAVEVNKIFGGGLDEAVAYLQECNKNGQNVYVDFNGHKLYSADVTIDSAYMKVVGMTKAEDEAIRKEYDQAKTDEEKKAIIAKWGSIKKGHQEEARGKKESGTVLDSAIEATEQTTTTGTINRQVQGIKGIIKGEKVVETKEMR